jgi:hypothetical protein
MGRVDRHWLAGVAGDPWPTRRHEKASADEGVHVKVHANVNMTLGVHAASMPNMQADAAKRVDARSG